MRRGARWNRWLYHGLHSLDFPFLRYSRPLWDIVVIVLHMKAFDDVPSWQRRQSAANALKSYLDTNYPTQKVIVVGDWNDDVDTSITAGQASPMLIETILR